MKDQLLHSPASGSPSLIKVGRYDLERGFSEEPISEPVPEPVPEPPVVTPGAARSPRRGGRSGRWLLALGIPALAAFASPAPLKVATPRPRPAVAIALPPAPPPPEAPPVVDEQDERHDDEPTYRVEGVIAPDTLNLRAAPGPRARLLDQIPADGRGIKATARRRRTGPSLWWEVEYRDQRGWVNGRYLAVDPSAGDGTR